MADTLFSGPLSTIRAFLMAAEFKNFTRAAEVLDLSQPSLSRILGALERELGAQLFVRSRRGVVLTDAGAHFQVTATNILRQMDELVSEIRSRELSPGGRVVVGLPVSMSGFISQPLSIWFANEFPNAQLSVHEGVSDELELAYSLGRLDIALLISTSRSHDAIPLANEQLYLHASGKANLSSAPVSWRTIGELPLILPRSSNILRRRIEEASRRYGARLDVVMEVNTPSTILSLVEAGNGYTILPASASRAQRARKTIAIAPIRGFKIVWSMLRNRNPAQPTLVSAAEKKLRMLIRGQADRGLWNLIERK